MNHPLDTILNPRSIAFFGANNAATTMGTTQLQNILYAGYPGKVFPIHPRLDAVLGLKAYKKLADVPKNENIDLAILVISAEHLIPVLEECGKRGIKHAVVITAGFREVGNTDLNTKLRNITRKYGIRFLGPNCIGFFNNYLDWVDESQKEDNHIAINTTWIPIQPKKGGVSFASQSGTFACHTFFASERLGMRFSKTISVGNEMDIDLVDCLEYLEQDPHTRVIGMYIEEIKRGREFIEVASRIVPKKPIVAVYVGGTEAGSRAVMSHTGSMGGNDKVFDAMAEQIGIIRAWNMEELLDYCHVLDVCPIPKGDRVAIFTNAGGPGVNMSDIADRLGLRVPIFSQELQQKLKKKIKSETAQVRNIVDLTFDVDLETLYRTIPRTILKSDEVDGMLMYGLFGWDFFEMVKKMGDNIVVPMEQMKPVLFSLLDSFGRYPRQLEKPIIGVNLMGREEGAVKMVQDAGVPVFPMPNRAVKAYWALWEYRKVLRKYQEK